MNDLKTMLGEEAVANIALLAQHSIAPKEHPHKDGLPFVIVPDGYSVRTLPLPDRPRREKGTVKLRDAASFIAYVNRFATVDWTLLYAQIDPARFVAVINDYGPPSPLHGVGANWRDWRVEFVVPASREWATWMKVNREHMSQIGFAEFIEDNLPDIVSPDGAELLELTLNFEATRNSAFKSAQRLQDGSVNFAWVDEGKDAGTVRVPKEFVIQIPVFERGALYAVTARLKYRINDGKLSIWYELVRPHKVLELAFDEIWKQITDRTGKQILLGTPE